MLEPGAPGAPPIEDLECRVIAMATIRTSLAFALECLGHSAVPAPDLMAALEDVHSLAARRELEARVLRTIQSAQLGAGCRHDPDPARAVTYETLRDLPAAPGQGGLQRRV